MGMHWRGYVIGIVGNFGRNKFVGTEQINYLAYVETYYKV
jgi:hypothetical protein